MSLKSLTGFDASSQQVSNVADGSAATDAINKQQLDAAIRGLDWKPEVLAASTANITLATPGTSIDGVTLTNPCRVLLKNQSAPEENGIYVWTATGSPLTRALDADSAAELSGSTTTVQQGTVNADRVYRVTADDPITLETTAITLVQVGAGASPYTAGDGLTLSGQDFAVGAGTGITVNANDVAVDTSVVARKASFSCAATTNPQTFTHNLATKDVTVQIREASGDALVLADVVCTDTNNVSVNFGGAPTSAQYRVTVVG